MSEFYAVLSRFTPYLSPSWLRVGALGQGGHPAGL